MYIASASATILLSLNSLNAQLNKTETELSTGNAINSAADNPVLWAAASSQNSAAALWGVVDDEIGDAISPDLSTATNGLSTVLKVLGDMETTVENVQSQWAAGDDNTTTALSTLQQYGQTMADTVDDAVTSAGMNLLDGSNSSVKFVEGYDQTGTVRTVSFTTQDLLGSSGYLQAANASGASMDLTALSATDLSSTTNIADTLANIKGAISNITSYSAAIGAMSSSESAAQSFAEAMQTNLQSGADDLVAANMSAVSAREAALQTQIQLATQALSISEQSSQYVLRLFQ